MVDAIPTLAWSARADGSADFFNQSWLVYTGLSAEQARDWGWTGALHSDDLNRLVDYWRSVLASGEFRVLRPGTNGWTCLPGFPGTIHDEPGCFDQVFLQFMKDSMAGRTPNVQRIGISYMYGGKWVPNKSHAMGSGKEFHVGPHIMIIGLDQKIMQTLNHDGSNGEPYVNHLPGHSELYLVAPIREWEDSQAVSTIGATR